MSPGKGVHQTTPIRQSSFKSAAPPRCRASASATLESTKLPRDIGVSVFLQTQYLLLISGSLEHPFAGASTENCFLERLRTKEMATDTRTKVFSIPELVETVLLHLSMRDLLRAQRVCRLWKATTDDSLTLQRKLFFHPVTDTDHEPEFNSLLRQVFSPIFPLTDTQKWDSSYTDAKRIYDAVNWYKNEGDRQTILRPEASWRRMFPTKPTARIEKVESDGGCDHLYRISEGIIRDSFQGEKLQERGATMGFLWDVAIHLLDSEPESWFCVHWHMFPKIQSADGSEKGPGRRSAISITHMWSTDCYPPESEPCGLNVGRFEPTIIKWGKEDSEE